MTAVPEMDLLRPARSCGQDDLGARDGELGAVVLPHPEERQPDLIGEHGLVDDVPDGRRIAQELARLISSDVSEGVETQFELCGVADGHGTSFHSSA